MLLLICGIFMQVSAFVFGTVKVFLEVKQYLY